MQILDHSFSSHLQSAWGGCSPRNDVTWCNICLDTTSINHYVMFLGRRERRAAFLLHALGRPWLGAGFAPKRQADFAWCLFWNWICKTGQSLCCSQGSLSRRVLSCEKSLWQELFWGRGQWVSSWSSFESSGERILMKSAVFMAGLVPLCEDLVCGLFEVKSWPEIGAQSHNTPAISASPGQPSEQREEAGAGRETRRASEVCPWRTLGGWTSKYSFL